MRSIVEARDIYCGNTRSTLWKHKILSFHARSGVWKCKIWMVETRSVSALWNHKICFVSRQESWFLWAHTTKTWWTIQVRSSWMVPSNFCPTEEYFIHGNIGHWWIWCCEITDVMILVRLHTRVMILVCPQDKDSMNHTSQFLGHSDPNYNHTWA